ncbi:HPP family protein [candidate division WOR-3 bacterium]|nr:HPP family protein [candidate division WOR-3 bacterium]
MKRLISKIVKELRLYWKNYVFQSLFATLAIFIVLLTLSLQEAVIIASIGATTFIVFAMPKSITAKPRNVIGGHLVGLISGSLCALIPHPLFLHSIMVYSLAVGFSIFIMVITDTEHPPASGTALGVAIHGFSLGVTIAVIIRVVILSLIHHLFKRYLRDLT